ncbi:hypothetical protein ACIPJG_29465 [Streptomyces halstedii]|uniref:hypothetical protein n=1 Tax=Streptomyces halstedii TaxID=1944 RepID=UPI00380BC043
MSTPASDQQGFTQAENLEGYELVRTPGDPEGTQIVGTPGEWDPEDVQLSARADGGDVVMYLPEITYLDTQPWSVEIGLTPERLVQLRDALDNHLRGAADHAGPANRGDTPTVPLRERLRAALRRHIDPDDDTMPTLEGTGQFLWVPADDALDDLIKALDGPNPNEVIARVAAALDTPSDPNGGTPGEYDFGWDTAMDLIRAAIEEQP